MKVAHFVSTYKHYDDEESGIKPYTIRDDTARNRKKLDGATHVCIHRAYTKVSFTREITHQLKWKDNLIAAWNPNKRKGSE